MKSPRNSIALLAMLVAQCFAADNTPINPEKFQNRIRVACVGDSITAGIGAEKGKDYPAQLADLLGTGWEVRNFGLSGTTMLKKGNAPYEPSLQRVLDFAPDVVVLMLGTNDTKPQNWIHKDEFFADYSWMVGQFQRLASHPRIFVCHPCLVSSPRTDGINEAGVLEQIPLIDKLAEEMKLGVIDMHGALKEKPEEYLPDSVHPSTAGATRLAKTVYRALTGSIHSTPPPVPKGAAPGAFTAGRSVGSYTYDGEGEGSLPSKAPSFPDPEMSKLTDGEIPATEEFQDPAWVGFQHEIGSAEDAHPQVTFEFSEKKSPKTISITYFHSKSQAGGSIRAPEQVLISVSDDGSHFDTPVSFTPFDPGDGGTIRTAVVELEKSLSGKFFRLDFRNPSQWTFLGEITFE